MLKSTAIAALRLCSCTAGAMMLTLERCGICRPWSSMDHYYIDLHPYSALVQFYEVQEEGVGVGKWRLQEAKLTVLLNLAELQRLQAVLAAAVLLREAGAPSCRGFSFSKYSAFLSWCSPCSPSCVRNLTCWHNPAHG